LDLIPGSEAEDPDSYWKYDELAEAYYHVESDTESIHWYEDSESTEEDPLEWNFVPQNTRLSKEAEGNFNVQVNDGLAHQDETTQCIPAELTLLDSNWINADLLSQTEEQSSEDLLMTLDRPSNWEKIWNYAAIEQTFAPINPIDSFTKETGASALESLISTPASTPSSFEQDSCQDPQASEVSQTKCPWQNCTRANEFRLPSELRYVPSIHSQFYFFRSSLLIYGI
jgi:hypothetical protein